MFGVLRIWSVIGLFAALLAAVPMAFADTYDVRHCNAGQSVSGFWSVPSGAAIIPGMTYTDVICQSGSFEPGGRISVVIVGRAGEDKYVMPAGTKAGWQFTAPSATRVVGLSGVSLMARPFYGRQVEAEVWNPETGATLASAPEMPFRSMPMEVAIPPTSRIAIGLRCLTATGCFWGGNGSTPEGSERWYLSNIRIRLQDLSPPDITGLRAVGEHWRSGGTETFDLTATDNIGLRELSLRVGEREVAATRQPCYDSATNISPTPCAGMNGRLATTVNVDSLPEGVLPLVIEARDPSGLATTRTYTLRVDRTAPGAPRELRLVGAEGWRATNRFDVAWAGPPERHDVAPLTGNEYEFCPETNGPYDSTGCVRQSRNLSEGATIDQVAVPSEGAWIVRVAHRDAAGNTNSTSVSTTAPLRLDTTPPSGEFEAFDPRDPTRVRLRAADAISGVARVEIEARRDGESAWHSLTVEGSGGQYSAVLDDALYPRGSYGLRARVFDRAENEKSILTAPGGTALKVSLPVRVETRMTAGRATRVRANKRGRPKYKHVLDARPTVDHGKTVTITGKLSDAVGNPAARVDVEVLERVDAPARPWQAIGTVHTNAAGTFTFKVPAGTSRTLRFSYAGSPTAQPSTKDVELRVRAAVTIKPDRRVLRNGDEVVFRGRVRSGPVPVAGKLVTLQALTRRGWTTFGNARARAKDGRWTYRYRFTGTTVRSRYSFRVVVPAESGFPYAQGASKTTRVLVNP